MGKSIDRHGTVWRINNAPTDGFESMVGHRTDIRVINHVMIDVWTGALRPKIEGSGRHRGNEFARDMCTASRCLLIDASRDHRLSKLKNHTVRPVHNVRQTVSKCTHMQGPLSSGYVAVMLALWSCPSPVYLYGFMPHCCDKSQRHSRLGWPSMNYKYSHTNESKWVCCASGRERMDIEFDAYLRLERRGYLKMHPTRGTYNIH
jgi:hypothetical protein